MTVPDVFDPTRALTAETVDGLTVTQLIEDWKC